MKIKLICTWAHAFHNVLLILTMKMGRITLARFVYHLVPLVCLRHSAFHAQLALSSSPSISASWSATLPLLWTRISSAKNAVLLVSDAIHRILLASSASSPLSCMKVIA